MTTLGLVDTVKIQREEVTMNTDWPWHTPEPGIYFDMSFEEYLSIPCIQSSSIKKLLSSPTEFWAESWMNPNREIFKKDTSYYLDGRAYHTRILEGKDIFYSLYAPDYEDDPNDKTVIRDTNDVRAALRRARMPTSFATKSAGIERLLRGVPDARVLNVLKKKHRDKYNPDGLKEFIPAETIRYIEYAAKMIELHPNLKHYFAGGYPEVTVIWDDPVYKVRFKARFDYLKIAVVSDLKSFRNQSHKRTEKAIAQSIDNYLYIVQAWLYMRAASVARGLIQEGQVYKGKKRVDDRWLNTFQNTPLQEFWFAFVQKGNAPVTRGVKFSIKDEKFAGVGTEYVEPAINTFKQCYDAFGEDFWVDMAPDYYQSYDDLWGF